MKGNRCRNKITLNVAQNYVNRLKVNDSRQTGFKVKLTTICFSSDPPNPFVSWPANCTRSCYNGQLAVPL